MSTARPIRFQAASGLDLRSLTQPVFNSDYSLAPGSTGKNAASDGTDMGANVQIVGVR
jgi:hypothetical protein